MRLELDVLDVKMEYRKVALGLIEYGQLTEQAQAAVLAAGWAVLYNSQHDSYVRVYAPIQLALND